VYGYKFATNGLASSCTKIRDLGIAIRSVRHSESGFRWYSVKIRSQDQLISPPATTRSDSRLMLRFVLNEVLIVARVVNITVWMNLSHCSLRPPCPPSSRSIRMNSPELATLRHVLWCFNHVAVSHLSPPIHRR
jgi:hypothetical protein